MSEYAFYWFMTERADLEQIEDCDNNKSWPATFEGFMEKFGDNIRQNNTRFTDDDFFEMWRIGIWQEGFIHALAKSRRGDEGIGVTWWSRDYEATESGRTAQ